MYVCWLAFEVVFTYVYVIETKNVRAAISLSCANPEPNVRSQRTLEETAALFDGEDASDKLAEAARQPTIVPLSPVESDPDPGRKTSDTPIQIIAAIN